MPRDLVNVGREEQGHPSNRSQALNSCSGREHNWPWLPSSVEGDLRICNQDPNPNLSLAHLKKLPLDDCVILRIACSGMDMAGCNNGVGLVPQSDTRILGSGSIVDSTDFCFTGLEDQAYDGWANQVDDGVNCARSCLVI